jgi:hypothetical protein
VEKDPQNTEKGSVARNYDYLSGVKRYGMAFVGLVWLAVWAGVVIAKQARASGG